MIAARVARALDRWVHLAEPYRSAAREAIARVALRTDLSSDVREIVTKALRADSSGEARDDAAKAPEPTASVGAPAASVGAPAFSPEP
jgi:aminopeptidase N